MKTKINHFILMKTELNDILRSRKNVFVFLTLVLSLFLLTGMTLTSVYHLFQIILISPGWSFIQSREMVLFMELLYPLLGVLSILALITLRTPKKLLLLPFVFFTLFAGSTITLLSEAQGIQKHGWQTLRAARFSLIAECLVLPIFVLVTMFSGWKKRKR